MTPHRSLALELPGEAAVAGQRLPQDPLGVGRIPTQQPGQPTHGRTVAGRRRPLPVLGQKRAQPRRLLAIKHAALGRPLAPLRDRHHHAVQSVHVLLGRVHAGEDVAQIDQHGLALLPRAEEFDLVEFPDQIVEEGLHLVLRGRLGTFGHRERQGTAGR